MDGEEGHVTCAKAWSHEVMYRHIWVMAKLPSFSIEKGKGEGEARKAGEERLQCLAWHTKEARLHFI